MPLKTGHSAGFIVYGVVVMSKKRRLDIEWPPDEEEDDDKDDPIRLPPNSGVDFRRTKKHGQKKKARRAPAKHLEAR
jgi:hypothetical protein